MKKVLIACLLLLEASTCAFAGTVTLKRAWVETYKNRATIDVSLIVDHAHKKPNTPQNDGDIHVAGRAQQAVGLPMVAEVMNAAAASQQAAVSSVHQVEGTGQSTPVTGVWRLWFEHPSASPQIQFAEVPPAGNTNPDHSFEIHPITKFGNNAVPQSFQFVPGGTPHPAGAAFSSYEKLTVSLNASSSAVSITSPKAGFNYTEFFIEFVGPVQKLDDGGRVVLANVLEEPNGEPVAEKIRMIFVPGTLPAQQLASNPPSEGDQWHVLGIPRINLEAIASFLGAAAKSSGTSAVNRKLPYEMIIVGVK